MKSKKKFLSLLVFAPLLVGCGNNVKAPKFAKYGDKMASFEAFKKEILNNLNSASFKKAAKIGSFEIKTKQSWLDEDQTRQVERNKKVIRSQENMNTLTGLYRFNADNLLIYSESKTTHTETSFDGNTKTSDESELNSKNQVQVDKIKNKDHLVMVDYLNKQYTSYTEVGSQKAADLYDEEAKYMLADSLTADMYSFISDYESEWNENTRKDCKFYKNGKIYTAELIHETKQSSPSSDYVNNWKYTVQVDFTEGKWTSKMFEEDVSVNTYKKNYATLAKGDVTTERNAKSSETSATLKKVGGKKVDISKYTPIFID